jgi:hypothetical protein
MQAYSIPFLAEDEKDFVDYLYLRRNNYVHNAGRSDTQLKAKLAKTHIPIKENAITTEAKRLRTRFGKMLHK